jgi:hypothetical protein
MIIRVKIRYFHLLETDFLLVLYLQSTDNKKRNQPARRGVTTLLPGIGKNGRRHPS